jgi:hypothetical protein
MATPHHNAGPWHSGLRRRIYNPCERVHARSEGPNPSRTRHHISIVVRSVAPSSMSPLQYH